VTLPAKFITKEAWGANPSKEATEDSHPIGATEGVTLHWEGPHMGTSSHTRCAWRVRAIERFHEYGRGWGDIAYNAIVCSHGYVFEGRGAGVRSAANGNTTANDTHYAVCYLGGEGDPFTDDGKAGFGEAVVWLRTEGNAGPEVNGHRDHKSTACPGDTIYAWLQSADWTNPTPTDWFDMATEKQLRAAVGDELDERFRDGNSIGNARVEDPDGGVNLTLGRLLYALRRDVAALRNEVADLKAAK
jgi:hypothetical protein